MKNMGFMGLFCFIVGGVLVYLGLNERAVASKASALPEVITLQNLIARGAEGNPNIILTDFVAGKNYVYEHKNGSWTSVWVPIAPRTGANTGQGDVQPGQIQAILFSIKVRNEAGEVAMSSSPRLRALVTNGLMSLGSKEKSLLTESYPGIDFSKCLIIQADREPAGAAQLFLMIGGGIALSLLGLGFLGFGIYRWRAERAPVRRKRRPRPDEDELEEEEEFRPRKKRPRTDD